MVAIKFVWQRLGLVFCLMLLALATANVSADERKCDCTIVPFDPSPPCFSACSIKSLKEASIVELQQSGLTERQSVQAYKLLHDSEALSSLNGSELTLAYLRDNLDREAFASVVSVVMNQELKLAKVRVQPRKGGLGFGVGILGAIGSRDKGFLSDELEKYTRDWYRYEAMQLLFESKLVPIEYANGKFYITLGAVKYDEKQRVFSASSQAALDKISMVLGMFRSGMVRVLDYSPGHSKVETQVSKLGKEVKKYLSHAARMAGVEITSSKRPPKECKKGASTLTAYVCDSSTEVVRVVLLAPRFKPPKKIKSG